MPTVGGALSQYDARGGGLSAYNAHGGWGGSLNTVLTVLEARAPQHCSTIGPVAGLDSRALPHGA